MKLVIFGLTMSSSWGNGHATLWRGLTNALVRRGHDVVFFERDVAYYAQHRDLTEIPGGTLVLHSGWAHCRELAERHLADADVGMVTSYCPDGLEATEAVLASRARLKAFYDLDTPVTLARLRAGEDIAYLGPRGLQDFDLVLSYTGGGALDALRTELGARRVAPLYGSVDPAVHHRVATDAAYAADLSYLGTYAPDRQAALVDLFIEPARRRPDRKFLIGGAQYPQEFPWTRNIFFARHVPPTAHAAFYSSGRITLNVTRQAMAEMGWCPSGRLFEAAACGAPILSDTWDGLDRFFAPETEILLADDTEGALAALDRSDAELRRIAEAAQARALAEHTADHRVLTLEAALDEALTAVPRAAA